MLESNKDSAKLDAMKRIVGVSKITSIFAKLTCCDYIKYVLNNMLNTKLNTPFDFQC